MEGKTLFSIVELVKGKLLEKFPGCGHTVQILLWDDGTSKIECRHGADDGTLYKYVFYNNELTYEEIPTIYESIELVDESGQPQLFDLIKRTK